MTLFTTWFILFVCSCGIRGVPHDDLQFKSTQNGGCRARILQVFPLPVEEVEQERRSFSGIWILFTVNVWSVVGFYRAREKNCHRRDLQLFLSRFFNTCSSECMKDNCKSAL